MDVEPERPFGMGLVAGWFVVGAAAVAMLIPPMIRAMQILDSTLGHTILGIAVTLEAVLVLALLGIAGALWRQPPRMQGAACVLLVLSAAAMVWKGATPPYYGVAAINLVALGYLVRAQRARSM